MYTAFVLIQASPAKEHIVYSNLLKLKELKELHPLFGEYDFIAKIVSEKADSIQEIVINKIRQMDGVLNTNTLNPPDFLD